MKNIYSKINTSKAIFGRNNFIKQLVGPPSYSTFWFSDSLETRRVYSGNLWKTLRDIANKDNTYYHLVPENCHPVFISHDLRYELVSKPHITKGYDCLRGSQKISLSCRMVSFLRTMTNHLFHNHNHYKLSTLLNLKER